MTRMTSTALNVVLLDLDAMIKRLTVHHDALSFTVEALTEQGAPRYAASVDAAMLSAYEAIENLLQVKRDLAQALTT